MVNWYKNLYVGDTAKKKQKKWMRRIENKKAVPGVWLLTLPVEAIALETYRETGEVKIREWLLNRIEGCE